MCFIFFPYIQKQEFFQPALSVCKLVLQAGITVYVEALVPRCDVNARLVMWFLRPYKALQADEVVP